MQTPVKRLLFVGVFNETSTNNSLADSFENLADEVIRFDYRGGKPYPDQQNMLLLSRLIEETKPQVTFFAKGNGLPSSFVEQANKYGRTIMWYMDPANQNFNVELFEKLEKCTLAFFALQEPFDAAKKLYGKKCIYLAEGYDPLVDYPQEGYEQIYDISFIGDLRGERREYVEAVNATHIQGAYGKDHAIAVAKSKINLNFTDGGPSDRVYKVLAAGGFLLTQPWPGIDEQFIEGVDLITFNSIETLRRESNYFLKNPKERQACAIVGKGTVKSYSREFFGSNIMFELERYELANGNKS